MTQLEVLGLVASAYGVERGRLRPDDRFADELSDMESWRLDVGAENLERALLERYELTLTADAAKFTVADLLRAIGATKAKSS